MRSRHLSVVVERDPVDVYEFARTAENLPLWASGLAQSEIVRDGDGALADSPMGRVRFVFAPRNEYGVLDHDVTLPSGETVTNPLRVIAHPDGAELIFTLRELADDDAAFEADAAMVEADLARLKELLEGPARPA